MLSDEDLDAIADRVADRMGRRRLGLATADELADELRVEVGWVYEHQAELGAIRLGSGKRAPLRFNLDRVRALLDDGALGPNVEHAPRPTGRPSGSGRAKSRLPSGVKPLRARGALR